MRRIGFLGGVSAAEFRDRTDAFRAGMRELGYVEGKNLAIEFRWAESQYERLPALAVELVRLNVEVIVTVGSAPAAAAKNATKTVPIVMALTGDAVATGLVASLARPGGNVTGHTIFNPELAAKRLEILREFMPKATRVAVISNPDNPTYKPIVTALDAAARRLKLELQYQGVRRPAELEGAFAAIRDWRPHAVMVNEDGMLIASVRTIVDLATQHRLPLIGFDVIAESGGLMAYGVNLIEVIRRSSIFVDKILRGAKPADIPVEQTTRFELILNRKAAAALGVPLTRDQLSRVDRLID